VMIARLDLRQRPWNPEFVDLSEGDNCCKEKR
jgi:hypothetical protein